MRHLTFDCTLSVDDALGAGVAGIGLAVPTGSLRLTAKSLVPNIAGLTGTASERALCTFRNLKIKASSPPERSPGSVTSEKETKI